MTVHSLPDAAMPAGAQRTWRGRLQMALILLVCAAPVIAGYLAYFVWRPGDAGAAYATLIQPTVGLPQASVRDLDGREVALSSLRGQWLLVVVGSARCGEDCERRLFLQRQLREMTGRERDRIDKVWLIVDDAPVEPRLRAAIGNGPAPVTVLRMSHERVAAWLRSADGHALDDHLYIVDPMGEWMMRAPAQPDPSKLKRDLERLLRASASWDLPGRPEAVRR